MASLAAFLIVCFSQISYSKEMRPFFTRQPQSSMWAASFGLAPPSTFTSTSTSLSPLERRLLVPLLAVRYSSPALLPALWSISCLLQLPVFRLLLTKTRSPRYTRSSKQGPELEHVWSLLGLACFQHPSPASSLPRPRTCPQL